MMIRMNAWIISFLCCLGMVSLYARDGSYHVRTYTTGQGLAHNHVRSILKDRTGFLWIATWDGLSRFDGHAFKNYYHTPGDTTTIPYFETHELFVDKHNNLWVQCGNKLALYLRHRDCFRSFRPSQNLDLNESYYAVGLNPAGEFHILFKGKLFVWDQDQSVFLQVLIRDSTEIFKGFEPSFTRFDNLGKLWCFRNDATYVLEKPDDKRNKKQAFAIQRKLPATKFPEPPASNFHLTVRVVTSSENRSWALTNAGKWEIGGGQKARDRIIPEGNFPGLGSLQWFQPGLGLQLMDLKAGRLKSVPLPASQLPEACYVDDDRNIWYGGMSSGNQGSGLKLMLEIKGHFKHYLTDFEGHDTLSVLAITEDRDHYLWAACLELPYPVRIDHAGKAEVLPVFRNLSGERNTYIRSILPLSDGKVLFGFRGTRICRYDPATGTIREISEQSADLKAPPGDRAVRIMVQLDEDRLLIAGRNILSVFSLSGQKTLNTFRDFGRFDLYSLAFYGRSILGGSNAGIIYSFDEHLNPGKKMVIPYSPYNLECILPDGKGGLYAALLGGGLAHYQPGSGSVSFITSQQGLANNTVYHIMDDDKGRLWLGTDQGISVVMPDIRSARAFGIADGLRIIEFNSDAACKASDGTLYMGGVGGFVGFNADSVMAGRPKPDHQLLITQLRVSGMPVWFSEPVYQLHDVTLARGSNNFSISFACPDLLSNDLYRFRYKLEGMNKDWVELDKGIREISFAAVGHGRYLLHLEAAGQSGHWDQRAQLSVSIPPFFYQTNGFRIAAVSIILWVAFWIIYLYIKQIRLKQQQEQYRLRQQSLRGQMNPHFIFNSLNSILLFIGNRDERASNNYVTRFSRLMRKFLDNTELEFIGLERELETLQDYLHLEQMRNEGKFSYDIVVDEGIDVYTTEVAPALIQPFLENAIWHGINNRPGNDGMLTLRFQSERNACSVIIEDNGIGISKAKILTAAGSGRHQSKGLQMIRERLDIIGKQEKKKYGFRDEEVRPGDEFPGTRIILDLPVKMCD